MESSVEAWGVQSPGSDLALSYAGSVQLSTELSRKNEQYFRRTQKA
jgi:hypothetical protein